MAGKRQLRQWHAESYAEAGPTTTVHSYRESLPFLPSTLVQSFGEINPWLGEKKKTFLLSYVKTEKQQTPRKPKASTKFRTVVGSVQKLT